MNDFTVYKHTTPSNKVYIGITSQSPMKRWKNGLGYEGCTAFFRAIKKYGWSNIKHEVLAEGLSKDQACAMEQDLIAEYQSHNPEFGYNLTSGGEHYEPNDEWRRKLSESNKRYYIKHPEARMKVTEKIRNRKPTAEELETRSKKMKQFFIDHPEQRYERGKSFRGKKRGEEFSRKLGERKSKPIICIETGKRYKSLVQASEELNVCRTGITNVLRGYAHTCGGYHFAYADNL